MCYKPWMPAIPNRESNWTYIFESDPNLLAGVFLWTAETEFSRERYNLHDQKELGTGFTNYYCNYLFVGLIFIVSGPKQC